MKAMTIVAKNPSEARGIRKALKAAGLKFEFKSTRGRGKKKKRNPARRGRTRRAGLPVAKKSKARRRRK